MGMRVKVETEQKFLEMQRQHEDMIVKIRKQYEDEVILQLRRQAMSHVAHVGDAVLATEGQVSDKLQQSHEAEKQELNASFEQRFADLEAENAEKMQSALRDHHTQMAKSSAALEGISNSVTQRNTLECKIESARRLQLAAKGLIKSVMRGSCDLTKD